jgi:hypothetical protein
MSNHYSAANLRFPGDDARLDFTDIYAFQEPGNAGKTILIIDVNPYTTGISAMPPFLMKPEFHPDGVYRINVDNNGDAHADAAFTFVFSELKDGTQTGTAYYATGSQARQPEPAARYSSQPRRSVSTPLRGPCRPAHAGCSPGSAAIRSSRMRTAPFTGSSGPGRTRSLTGTYSPSRWRCPATCLAPIR